MVLARYHGVGHKSGQKRSAWPVTLASSLIVIRSLLMGHTVAFEVLDGQPRHHNCEVRYRARSPARRELHAVRLAREDATA
jgi:hypothetical protein